MSFAAQSRRIAHCDQLGQEYEAKLAEWTRVWWWRWFRGWQLWRELGYNLRAREELLMKIVQGVGASFDDEYEEN